MFTALSKAPVLIAMMAGEAANLDAPNEVEARLLEVGTTC